MDCIQKTTEEEQRKALVPKICNEIIRDLVSPNVFVQLKAAEGVLFRSS